MGEVGRAGAGKEPQGRNIEMKEDERGPVGSGRW